MCAFDFDWQCVSREKVSGDSAATRRPIGIGRQRNIIISVTANCRGKVKARVVIRLSE